MRILRLLRLVVLALVAIVVLFMVTGALYDPDPAPLRLERQVASVDGIPMSYHQRGRGPDVVLLHGGMGSAEDFEPVLDALAADFRVTAVDRPGFGLSRGGDEDVTYPGNGRLVAGLTRSLGLVNPVVVGHSHGGGVALQLAEEHPEVAGALVLIAPAAYPEEGFPAAQDWLGALPLFGDGMSAWVGAALGPSAIRSTLERMLGPDRAKVPADFIAYRQRLWTAPRSLVAHARQRLTDAHGLRGVSKHLREVKVPAVVLACAEDPEEGHSLDSRRLARELPQGRLVWLEGCGHYIQYGRPEAVVAAVRAAAASARAKP